MGREQERDDAQTTSDSQQDIRLQLHMTKFAKKGIAMAYITRRET
jgi:hypothetical protein